MESKQEYRFDFSSVHVFSGYYKDVSVLTSCASGGVATVISEFIINDGGCVFGSIFSDDFKSAYYLCAESIDDLEKLKGSKYIITNKTALVGDEVKPLFKACRDKLNDGYKVLFVGLGCDVGALKKYLDDNNVNQTNLYTIDLICHGPTFPEVQAQFVEMLENKYNSKVQEFSVRYKKRGWTPPFLYALFENGKVYCKPFYDTEFGYTFRILSKENCFNCKYKGDSHVADITIGDYWGLSPQDERYNPHGVSVMFTRSAKGDFLINSIDNERFVVCQAEPQHATEKNPMFYMSRSKASDFEEFKRSFEEHGLHYAVIHSDGYRDYKIKMLITTIKRMIKRIIKFV